MLVPIHNCTSESAGCARMSNRVVRETRKWGFPISSPAKTCGGGDPLPDGAPSPGADTFLRPSAITEMRRGVPGRPQALPDATKCGHMGTGQVWNRCSR